MHNPFNSVVWLLSFMALWGCDARPDPGLLLIGAPSHACVLMSGFVELGHAGKAKYDSKKHALVWKIKRFNGGGATDHKLAANVELIATTRDKKAWSRPPISMNFQVTPSCLITQNMPRQSLTECQDASHNSSDCSSIALEI